MNSPFFFLRPKRKRVTMRKISILFFLFISITGNLFAVEIASEGTMQRKLQRGFLNIALSPIELSNQFAKRKNEDTILPSWIRASLEGTAYLAGRALVGAYEIATFPVAAPASYKPVLQPEFAWEYLGEKETPAHS